MAFPFVFQENFELGTKGNFDTESDTGSLLDFPHVSTLAGINGIGPAAPFRGAYCMRIVMGDTNDHTLEEADMNVAASGTGWFRFYLYLGNDVAATADDTFNIFELKGTGTTEAAIGLRITASTDAVEIGIGETAPTAFATPLLTKGVWHAIELKVVVDSGIGNDGTLELFVDGASVATVATLDQGAITDGFLGTQDTLSTTTGTLLFDQFVQDDLRIYPIVDRYPLQLTLTQSSHVFVGPGLVSNVSLLSGAGTDNVLSIYDTSRGNTNDALKIGVELKNTANNELVDPAGMPIQVTRGCFVVMTGTNPRGVVNVEWAPGYSSVGAVRTVASRLKLNPAEVL